MLYLGPEQNSGFKALELDRLRNVQWFRGGLVFKAQRLLYHSTLGLRVIKKKRNLGLEQNSGFKVLDFDRLPQPPQHPRHRILF